MLAEERKQVPRIIREHNELIVNGEGGSLCLSYLILYKNDLDILLAAIQEQGCIKALSKTGVSFHSGSECYAAVKISIVTVTAKEKISFFNFLMDHLKTDLNAYLPNLMSFICKALKKMELSGSLISPSEQQEILMTQQHCIAVLKYGLRTLDDHFAILKDSCQAIYSIMGKVGEKELMQPVCRDLTLERQWFHAQQKQEFSLAVVSQSINSLSVLYLDGLKQLKVGLRALTHEVLYLYDDFYTPAAWAYFCEKVTPFEPFEKALVVAREMLEKRYKDILLLRFPSCDTLFRSINDFFEGISLWLSGVRSLREQFLDPQIQPSTATKEEVAAFTHTIIQEKINFQLLREGLVSPYPFVVLMGEPRLSKEERLFLFEKFVMFGFDPDKINPKTHENFVHECVRRGYIGFIPQAFALSQRLKGAHFEVKRGNRPLPMGLCSTDVGESLSPIHFAVSRSLHMPYSTEPVEELLVFYSVKEMKDYKVLKGILSEIEGRMPNMRLDPQQKHQKLCAALREKMSLEPFDQSAVFKKALQGPYAKTFDKPWLKESSSVSEDSGRDTPALSVQKNTRYASFSDVSSLVDSQSPARVVLPLERTMSAPPHPSIPGMALLNGHPLTVQRSYVHIPQAAAVGVDTMSVKATRLGGSHHRSASLDVSSAVAASQVQSALPPPLPVPLKDQRPTRIKAQAPGPYYAASGSLTVSKCELLSPQAPRVDQPTTRLASQTPGPYHTASSGAKTSSVFRECLSLQASSGHAASRPGDSAQSIVKS